MAVVSDELCDADDQPPHDAGVQSDPGGRVDPPGGREQGRNPDCPSPLSLVTNAGTLPGISCHHCHGDPRFPADPSTGHGPLDLDSSEESQAEGHGHILGSPCS